MKLASPFLKLKISTITQWAHQGKPHFEPALDNVPKLLAHSVARIFNLEIPSLGNYLFGREWPLGVPPSRVGPPLLDSFDVVLVDLIL